MSAAPISWARFSDLGMSYGHPGGAFYIYTNVSSTGLPSPFCEVSLLRQGRRDDLPLAACSAMTATNTCALGLQPRARIKGRQQWGG